MTELDLKELVEFEDNKEYYIVNRISYNKDFYVLMMNKEDSEDILIQKEVLLDGEISFLGIKNEEDFQEVLKRFSQIK